MRIYLTAPFDDGGIKVVETLAEPVGDVFSYREGGLTWTARGWYREGTTWHRARASAVKAAVAFRSARIAKAATDVAALSALPEPK